MRLWCESFYIIGLVYGYLESHYCAFKTFRGPNGICLMSITIFHCRYIKPPIFTLCVGNAWGEASLLLSAGAKGNRSALPSSTIMMKQVFYIRNLCLCFVFSPYLLFISYLHKGVFILLRLVSLHLSWCFYIFLCSSNPFPPLSICSQLQGFRVKQQTLSLLEKKYEMWR